MVDKQKVNEIFKKIGKPVINISILGQGEASSVLKVLTNDGTYSLKTALYPERKNKVLNEVNFRNKFINQGIVCIPAPIYSDSEIFPNGAVIYKFVKGRHPDFRNIDVLEQLAHIIAEIHMVNYEIIDQGYSQIEQIYQNLRDTISRNTERYPLLMNSKIISAFSKGLDEFKEILKKNKSNIPIGVNSQLHGDLSNNFVIDSNKKIWLIDWENSEFGDIIEELCFFLYMNEIPPKLQAIFFQEYQKVFEITQKINLENIKEIYFASYPIFNICWGISQLGVKLEQRLEPPSRKLNDLAITAREWSRFYSDSTSTLMIDGIKELRRTLLETDQ